jgi:hypothetical protein
MYLMMIENIINTIVTREEKRKIEDVTFLSLVDLVKPRNKNRKKNLSFLIFRKDLQARLAFEKGPTFTSNLKFVSSIASGFLEKCSNRTKNII